MKYLKLHPQNFGDFVRRMMETNSEFQEQVRSYRTWNKIAQRNPTKVKTYWFAGWFHVDQKENDMWVSSNESGGKDSVLDYMLQDVRQAVVVE